MTGRRIRQATIRQATLRGLYLLMRRALGRRLADAELEELAEINSQQLVRVATAHSVANLIARALQDREVSARLDPALAAFLLFLQERNRIRNANLKAQLIGAATALGEHGIKVVALKGAAELMSPHYGNAADRFLGDLDVLVPADRIDDAIAVLESRHYTSHGAIYDRSNRHAPALWHAEEPTAIELHTAPSHWQAASILPARDFLRRSVASSHPFVFLPCTADRLCHLVTHAQIDSGRFGGHWMLLRDAADLHVLVDKLTPEVWLEVRSRFAAGKKTELFDSFVLAASLVMGEQKAPIEFDWQAAKWAEETLRLLAFPEQHRWRYVVGTARQYAAKISREPLLAAKLFATLCTPSRVRRFCSHNIAMLRGFQ